MKNNERNRRIGMAFLLLALIALLSDFFAGQEMKNGSIERAPIGGEEKELLLNLEIDGVAKEEYRVEILPQQPTQEEAAEYLRQAIATIETDFQEIAESLPMKKKYENGAVHAKWMLYPYGVADDTGKINYEKVEESGTLMHASVTLTCGVYEKEYQFGFWIMPKELSEKDKVLQELQNRIHEQMQNEGEPTLKLPSEVNGYQVKWTEEREYLTPQILLLEAAAITLMYFAEKQRKMQEEQKRIDRMEHDYPEVVSQLSMLLGAGMTTRQAWSKIASQYKYKKENGMVEANEVYEAILRMTNSFSEGESERNMYQKFSQEIPAISYHKLMRILLGNLEKGTHGICERLEEECRISFEQRITYAKKLGEEASTKMIFPLMLMLALVMGIVIIPALIEFQM